MNYIALILDIRTEELTVIETDKLVFDQDCIQQCCIQCFKSHGNGNLIRNQIILEKLDLNELRKYYEKFHLKQN